MDKNIVNFKSLLKNYKRSSKDISCLNSKLSLYNICWTFKIKSNSIYYKHALEHSIYKKVRKQIELDIHKSKFTYYIYEMPSPVFKYFQYIDISKIDNPKDYIIDIIKNTLYFCDNKYGSNIIEGYNDADVYISLNKNRAMVIYKYLFVNNYIMKLLDRFNNITRDKDRHNLILPYTLSDYGDDYSFVGWFNYINNDNGSNYDEFYWIRNAYIRLNFGICAINGYNGSDEYEYLKYPYYDDKIKILYKTDKDRSFINTDVVEYVNHYLPYEHEYEIIKILPNIKNNGLQFIMRKKGLRLTKNMTFQLQCQPFSDPKQVSISIDNNGNISILKPQVINNIGKIDKKLISFHTINRFNQTLDDKIKKYAARQKTLDYIKKLIKKKKKK